MLTTYQLVQVPTADADVALVLIHALAEVADVVRAGGVLVLLLVGTALPQTVVHGLGVGGSLLLGLSGGTGTTAAEKTANGVADGGADCNTAGRKLALGSRVKSSTPDFVGKLSG